MPLCYRWIFSLGYGRLWFVLMQLSAGLNYSFLLSYILSVPASTMSPFSPGRVSRLLNTDSVYLQQYIEWHDRPQTLSFPAPWAFVVWRTAEADAEGHSP